MDVIINAQIGRLNEYVVFPSDVDNYNFICQAMCQVRSTMASSHDMNVENVPLKCVLRVEQLLLAGVSNNTNISDNNNPVQRKKSFRKRRRENDENYLEDDAIQNIFEQQRGTGEGDKRQLVEDGVLESPITGPKKVAPDGSERSINKIGTSFYGDE